MLTSGRTCCRIGLCNGSVGEARSAHQAPCGSCLWAESLLCSSEHPRWEASSGMIRNFRAPRRWASGPTSPPGPEQSQGGSRRDAAPEMTVLGSRVKILSNYEIFLGPTHDLCWLFHTHLGKYTVASIFKFADCALARVQM